MGLSPVCDTSAGPNTGGDPSYAFDFLLFPFSDPVWVTLCPLPYGGLSNSKNRLHYWTGHSEWLLLTSCCSSLTCLWVCVCVSTCLPVCLCGRAFAYLCVHVLVCVTPSDLFPIRKWNPLWDFFLPPSQPFSFYYFTCTSLSHWVCSHAATNSQTSIGSIYLVDRSAEWLLLLSRPHKNHSN